MIQRLVIEPRRFDVAVTRERTCSLDFEEFSRVILAVEPYADAVE